MSARGRTPPTRPARGPSVPSWTNDAWIFASLAGTGRTTLTALLWRADAINHLIPTAAEIRTALRGLHARGLIAVRGRAIGLSRRGRLLHAAAFRPRRGLFSIVSDVAKALAASPVQRRAHARPDLGFVTEAAVRRAYDEYNAIASALR